MEFVWICGFVDLRGFYFGEFALYRQIQIFKISLKTLKSIKLITKFKSKFLNSNLNLFI